MNTRTDISKLKAYDAMACRDFGGFRTVVIPVQASTARETARIRHP